MSNDLEEVEVIVLEERENSYRLQLKDDPSKVDFFPRKGEHGITFSRRNMKTSEAVAEIPSWMLTARNW